MNLRRCDSCGRHVLAIAPICPFCAQTSLLSLGAAAVTPIVLSACYGMPPCEPGETVDLDGDGYSIDTNGCYYGTDMDCNDDDPTINPGAEEVCGDDIDQNCDGIVAGPESSEYCGNGLDDDCDGEVDEVDCLDPYATTYDTGATTPPTTPPTTTSSRGRMSITYTWSATAPVTTCAEAGVVFLDGTIDKSGTGAPVPIGVVCDDQPIQVDDLPPGAYAIEINAVSDDGVRTYSSGAVAVEVQAATTATVDVVLTCASATTGGCG